MKLPERMLMMPAVKLTIAVKMGRRSRGTTSMDSALSAGLERLAKPARMKSAAPTTATTAEPNLSPLAMINIKGMDVSTVKTIVPTLPIFLTTRGVKNIKTTMAT